MLKKYEELGKKDKNSKHKHDLRKMGEQSELPTRLIDFIIESDKINSEMINNKSKDYFSIQRL